MKLNPDCVRDTLLCLEKNLVMVNGCKVKELSVNQICDDEFMSEYSQEDVIYSLLKLNECHYITASISYAGLNPQIVNSYIKDITWEGHQFLNTVRPKNVWQATKDGASKLGIMSIQALTTIAMEITKAIITNPTVINGIIQNM